MSNETETNKEQTNETLESNNDVLNQTRLRSHKTVQRSNAHAQRQSEAIVNALIKLKSLGKAESTLKHVSYKHRNHNLKYEKLKKKKGKN